MARPKPRAKPTRAVEPDPAAPRCGLCGGTTRLTRTECCENWICDDEDDYQLFSYARNSCFRNHRRYTLCGYHHAEGHPGRWQDCATCREDPEPEFCASFGTNDSNYRVIRLAEKGWTQSAKKRSCENCMDKVR